jgi:hypothetical protein
MKLKNLISVLFAAVIVCIALPMSARAAETEEISAADFGGSGPTVSIVIAECGSRIFTTGQVEATKPITVNILAGASVLFEANLVYTGANNLDAITFTGSGSLEIDNSIINGSSTANLIKIDPGLSSVSIAKSTITNSTGTAVDTNSNLTIKSGTITGTKGINASGAGLSIAVNGGDIFSTSAASTENDAAVIIDGAGTVLTVSNGTISGYAGGGNSTNGIILKGRSSISVTGGTLRGVKTIYATDAASIQISGGMIQSNSQNPDDAVLYVAGTGLTAITISKGSIPNGSHNGVYVNNENATLEITGGSISGINAFKLDSIDKVDISGNPQIIGYNDSAIKIGNTDATVVVNTSGGLINGLNSGIHASGGTISMTSGSVMGGSGIFSENAVSVTLSGGTVTATGNSSGQEAAVYITGATATTIDNVTLVGTNTGIRINNSSATLQMRSGTVSGKQAINVMQAQNITISGGTINGESTNGTGVITSATTTISGGQISGYTGLNIQNGTTTVTGGTFSTTTKEYGFGIHLYIGVLNIAPTASTPILVQGGAGALVYTNPAPDFTNVSYYIASPVFDGTGKALYNQSSAPYPLPANTNYRYAQFLATVPSFNVTANGGSVNGGGASVSVPAESSVIVTPTSGPNFLYWTASGITLTATQQTASTLQFLMPLNAVTLTAVYGNTTYEPGLSSPSGFYGDSSPSVTPIVYPSGSGSGQKVDYILVIATLNKSGSVNSLKTTADVGKAHQRAVRSNISKIILKIPEDGVGISKSAMKTIYKAAGGTKLYLTFGFYELKDDGKTEEDIGTFFLPLNDKSGQLLTGISFKSNGIYTVQDYIENKWETGILGSFETTHKGGWGVTATVSMSVEKLGLGIDDGERVYALIYDTKTKKFYQSSAKINDGNVEFVTSRSGVVTIVTKSVK